MERVIVAVRVRPLNEKEMAKDEKSIWNIDSVQNKISITGPALCDLIESKALASSASVSCELGIVNDFL